VAHTARSSDRRGGRRGRLEGEVGYFAPGRRSVAPATRRVHRAAASGGRALLPALARIETHTGTGGAGLRRQRALGVPVFVSAPFPLLWWPVVTENHLCRACSCQEILRMATARQAGRELGRAAAEGQRRRGGAGRLVLAQLRRVGRAPRRWGERHAGAAGLGAADRAAAGRRAARQPQRPRAGGRSAGHLPGAGAG
jgi:hypothetical protein